MELLLQNGDYVPDGVGGFSKVSGGEELLQRILFRLAARRGSFPLMPDFGSKLFLLLREKASQREALARQYVTEALAEETEVSVTNVTLTEEDGQAMVNVDLIYRGESFAVEIQI